MTIIATPGADDANSYATLIEADEYHATRLHNAAWTNADDTIKEASLIWAARTLDANFIWEGVKATDAQAMQWPRYNVADYNGYAIPSDEVPISVKWAQSELAFLLIEADRTLAADPDPDAVREVKMGPMTLKFDAERMQAAIASSVVVLVQGLGKFTGAGTTSGGSVLKLVRV